MERSWWQLPGPSQFIEEVASDLRQGRNVIIALPNHHPMGLREAVNARVSLDDHWCWRSLRVTEWEDEIIHPATLLHQRFAPLLETSHQPPSAHSLIKSERFIRHLIWLEGFTPPLWKRWKSFLEEYADLCRNKSEDERSLFCVSLTGVLVEELSGQDIALSVRTWRNITDQLDMSLYLSQLLPDNGIPKLLRRLRIAIVTELAGSDPEVSRMLIQLDLDSLLTPHSHLMEFAQRRGWNESVSKQPQWHEGQFDILEGRLFIHSAVLVASGNANAEINRRIWRAQVGVLFPYVEEQRIWLLEELQNSLIVPFKTDYGVIDNIEDLEIGHILYQISNSTKQIRQDTYQLLHTLVAVRKEIAHLKTVSSKLLYKLL